jgi:hypothetical protein
MQGNDTEEHDGTTSARRDDMLDYAFFPQFAGAVFDIVMSEKGRLLKLSEDMGFRARGRTLAEVSVAELLKYDKPAHQFLECSGEIQIIASLSPQSLIPGNVLSRLVPAPVRC